MQNIIKRIQSIVEKSPSFGYAVANLAEDMGIDIGLEKFVPLDIVNILPSVENISPVQFRLAVVTAIVRSFDPLLNDKGKVPYLREMFEKFVSKDLLTLTDMQGYHTMMFLLHPYKKPNVQVQVG